MEQFTTLLSISVEHTYYTTPVRRHLQLSPTLETERLMKRRGILFVENEDGWTWLVAKSCAGFEPDDVLELSMQTFDADFFRVTRLEEYHPQTFYELTLENKKNVEVATALAATDEKKWAAEFCRIRVRPTPELLKKARREKPVRYMLRFQSKAFRWEYLFVIRNNDTENLRNLLLEETKNRIIFEKAERLTDSSFGTNVWRTVSTVPVSALERPEYQLVLFTVLQENPLKKRTVSRFIQCPQPGKYTSDDPGMIRKVCYI